MRLKLLLMAGALALSGCGADGAAPPVSPSTVDPAEIAFLDVTAAHLCGVQSRVYADPAALAAAYQSSPQYPGLPDAKVAAFKERLTTDAAFAGRLTQRIQATCGTLPSPG
jgi:hypothetical protein